MTALAVQTVSNLPDRPSPLDLYWPYTDIGFVRYHDNGVHKRNKFTSVGIEFREVLFEFLFDATQKKMIDTYGAIVAQKLKQSCTKGFEKKCEDLPQKLFDLCENGKHKNCYKEVFAGVKFFANQTTIVTTACKWLTKPKPSIPPTLSTIHIKTTMALPPPHPSLSSHATTIISDSSTDASSNFPFVIVAVITVLAFIAIGISLFCYCKKKKASEK
ncbi:hypothetical protein GCK72_004545 [Caenorhabditis remanei]|uniref:Uncharacterized protein n=1 Tax=Caenorhabditis remanei TaxID=31234 RepID=A0A6A5HCP5_CAERE|nr:hypothetical protein GCK72_004545 [Caenorhabditis remanei]KAF1764596.1 hypothetical protein GCK72_004545 [Caenorhabditis remanei]